MGQLVKLGRKVNKEAAGLQVHKVLQVLMVVEESQELLEVLDLLVQLGLLEMLAQ